MDSAPKTQTKKRRCGESVLVLEAERSDLLQALPQDILIKVLCCVNHGDLKHLVQVSKAIREASLIAMESHFYRTPKTMQPIHLDSPPNVPKTQQRKLFAADFGDSCWREASVAQSTGSIFSEAFLWRTFVYNFDFELPRLIFIPDVI